MVESEDMARGKNAWRSAFLTGIVTCIVVAVLVFGASLFTSIVSILTLIIGVLNALLGHSTSGTTERNWFLSLLTQSLNVSPFLKGATIAVWLATASLAGYGVIHSRYEAQQVILKGNVRTASGAPASNARITILTSEKRKPLGTITAANDGTFTSQRIDLHNEPSRKLNIRVEWNNQETEETIDLAANAPDSLEIRLPPGEPPFRVSYIVLKGHAVDLFLRGEIDKKWEERLGGKPAIVPNSVYTSLKNLTEHYSVPFEGGEAVSYEIENKSGSRENQSLAATIAGKPSFVGSQQDQLSRDASKSDLLSLSDPSSQWRLLHDPTSEFRETPDLRGILSFWRFGSREDIESFLIHEPGTIPRNTIVEYLSYITRDYMPSDFCLLEMSSEGCGGGETMLVDLRYRTLQLGVAVVENITDKPIHLGKFAVRQHTFERIRNRVEDEAKLRSEVPEPQDLLSQGVLGAHEKLMIATDMPLVYEREDITDPKTAYSLSDKERNDVTNGLTKVRSIRFRYGEDNPSYVEIKSSQVTAILDRPAQDPQLEKEYLFGPSVNIESVDVDQVKYPFRQHDRSKFVIRSEATIGSCPYIYTYSPENNSWLREGHVLYGLNGKQREAIDGKLLRRFDGRILIKELDPEVSFIDWLCIKVTTPDGRQALLYPSQEQLRRQDGDYLMLRQGDRLEVSFKVPPDLVAGKYSVLVKGYYVPFKKAPSWQSRR